MGGFYMAYLESRSIYCLKKFSTTASGLSEPELGSLAF